MSEGLKVTPPPAPGLAVSIECSTRAHIPDCAHSGPATIEAEHTAVHCKGDDMTYDFELLLELRFDAHLRQQRRSGRPPSSDQQIIPKIDMVVGSWHLDELRQSNT